MKILRLITFHLKRYFPSIFGLMMVPLFMNGFFLYMNQMDTLSPEQTYLIINDSEIVANNIETKLPENIQANLIEDREKAMQQLAEGEVPMVYHIPQDFISNKTAQIKVLSINGKNRDPFLEARFNESLIEYLKEVAYANIGQIYEKVQVKPPLITYVSVPINEGLAMTTFLTSFLTAYTAGFLANDLADMRKSRMLKRSLATNTSGFTIIGSQTIAFGLLLFLSSLASTFILALIFNLPLVDLRISSLIYLSISLFTVGLTLLLFRLFKDQQLIILLSVVIIISSVAIATFELEGIFLIEHIKYLSPFYWVIHSLDTGVLFPNIFIIIAIAFVLITAGTFNAEKLAKL